MPSRKHPRPFSLHRGNGQITEEATAEGPYHNPTIQLLEFEDGSLSLRFCYFSHDGRFQRSPLIIGDDTIPALRQSIKQNPKIQSLLRQLLD